jgi:soluble lytic murein transglycosylase
VGDPILTPKYRSALVAALASASLLTLVHTAAAQTTAQQSGSTSQTAAKPAAKSSKTAHKHTAAKSDAKSKDGKSKDAKSKDGKSKDAKSKDSKSKDSKSKEAKSKDKKSNAKDTAAAPLPDAGTAEAAPAARRISPSKVPLAQAPTPETPDSDIALVNKAIDALRDSGASEATRIQASISDPVARKLVEWVILRSDDNGASFSRYSAFITGNPSWPSLNMFRRRAEAMLWVEDAPAAQVRAFFNASPPLSAKGRLVFARALTELGDKPGAETQVRTAWRGESFSGDVERQVLDQFSEFLTRADHKARMDKCLDVGDSDCAMRAARRLGSADVAIAQVRIALNKKSGNATKLLESVPEEARRDPGYIFAKLQVLRRAEKIAEAGQLMMTAPRDATQVYDAEEWWVERRILARKLLDIGDPRTAYHVVRDGAEPVKENSRVERQFMSGWIALRFLNDPATAAKHFARIQDLSIHPTSLGRSHYWLGRAAEAANKPNEAHAEYRAAASSSAAYYGQMARARLGMDALALSPPPITPDKRASAERLELVRALHILYALNERNLVIPLMGDLGDKLNDAGILAALGELAESYRDPRGMLHLGKAALARGLPLDYYAFPTVGVPDYTPIGPQIDSAILFAIIRQESMFNPADYSAAQAMGLMQVTPVAAKDTCKRYACTYDVKRLKNDMPYNLQIGAAEIAGVIQDYRGNLIMAFAGYNAGRGRVKEWVERYGDPRDPRVDPIDWVERIPFQETRNYVQRVMENYQVYRTLFANGAKLTIEADLRRGGGRGDN